MSAQIAVIMGSKSDWETMKHACDVLDQLEIPYEKRSFPPIVLRILCSNMPGRPGNGDLK